MARLLRAGEKPLLWVGSSREDLLRFPEAVKDNIGAALSLAQFGGKHPAAKPWKGEGPGVFEVVDDFMGNTYRAVYTVRFAEASSFSTPFRRSRRRG
jgi:phage-related protein